MASAIFYSALIASAHPSVVCLSRADVTSTELYLAAQVATAQRTRESGNRRSKKTLHSEFLNSFPRSKHATENDSEVGKLTIFRLYACKMMRNMVNSTIFISASFRSASKSMTLSDLERTLYIFDHSSLNAHFSLRYLNVSEHCSLSPQECTVCVDWEFVTHHLKTRKNSRIWPNLKKIFIKFEFSIYDCVYCKCNTLISKQISISFSFC